MLTRNPIRPRLNFLDRAFWAWLCCFWLIIGAPEELEFLQGSKSQMDLSLIYPVDPKQLPKELAGVEFVASYSERGSSFRLFPGRAGFTF
jgi:hypothetical protein